MMWGGSFLIFSVWSLKCLMYLNGHLFLKIWEVFWYYLMNMFSRPLTCTYSPSSVPMMSQSFYMFCSYLFRFFLCLHLHVIMYLPCLEALILYLQFDPGYWRDFQVFWLTELFISKISIWFLDHFKKLFEISSISLSIVFVTVELLSFERVTLPCYLIFLMLLYWLLCIWSQVLITCSISVEIVSMLRHESVGARLRCYFSPWYLGYGSVAKHSPTCSVFQAWSTVLLRWR
jgi:hypothetical protein